MTGLNVFELFDQDHLWQVGQQAGDTAYMDAQILVDDLDLVVDEAVVTIRDWSNEL